MINKAEMKRECAAASAALSRLSWNDGGCMGYFIKCTNVAAPEIWLCRETLNRAESGEECVQKVFYACPARPPLYPSVWADAAAPT